MYAQVSSGQGRAILAEQRRAEMFVTVSIYRAKAGEEDAIIALHEDWPSERTNIPGIGMYEPMRVNRAVLQSVQKRHSSESLDVGIFICRIPGNGLRFDISSYPDYRIEYNPGQVPTSFQLTYWPFPIQMDVMKYSRLDESWYIVMYHATP